MSVATKPKFSNPFSAKRIVPGAMPFVRADRCPDTYLSELATRFSRFKLGQVVGPHGCGKTTLVKAIIERMGDVSARFIVVRNRKLIETIQQSQDAAMQQVVVVDGLERIPLLHRVAFTRFAKSQKDRTRFIVTAHRKIFGWPLISELQPTFEQFSLVAGQLIRTSGAGRSEVALDESVLRDAYTKADGNYRDAVMLLYDVVGAMSGIA